MRSGFTKGSRNFWESRSVGWLQLDIKGKYRRYYYDPRFQALST